MNNGKIPMPEMCGGSVENRVAGLSETIKSDEIVSLGISCNFSIVIGEFKYRYVSLYAVRMKDDKTYIFFTLDRNNESVYAITDFNILEKLQLLVREYNLSRNNGYSHYVNGLPDNFGGTININYASGERIYRSDNQSSVISPEATDKMAELFIEAASDRYCSANAVKGKLVDFDYNEYNSATDSRSVYHLKKDGNEYILYRENRYPKFSENVYTKEVRVGRQVIEKLEGAFKRQWLNGFERFVAETDPKAFESIVLTYVFDDGSRYTVNSDLKLPFYMSNLCFDIHMYLDDEIKKTEENL